MRFLADETKWSGRDLRALMRKHNVTIRELSQRMGITQIRVRIRRNLGFTLIEGNSVRDFKQAITGIDPGPQ